MKESTMQSEPVISLAGFLSEALSSVGMSPIFPMTTTVYKLDAKFFSLALLTLGLEAGSDLVGAYFHSYSYAVLPKLIAGHEIHPGDIKTPWVINFLLDN